MSAVFFKHWKAVMDRMGNSLVHGLANYSPKAKSSHAACKQDRFFTFLNDYILNGCISTVTRHLTLSIDSVTLSETT